MKIEVTDDSKKRDPSTWDLHQIDKINHIAKMLTSITSELNKKDYTDKEKLLSGVNTISNGLRLVTNSITCN